MDIPRPEVRDCPAHYELVEQIRCPLDALPERLRSAFAEIAEWAQEHGVSISRPFTRYASFTPAWCKVEVGYIADSSVPVEHERITCKNGGGYVAISATYEGPQGGIGSTYRVLEEHMARNRYTSGGTATEYLLSPPGTETGDETVEIEWPIVRARR